MESAALGASIALNRLGLIKDEISQREKRIGFTVKVACVHGSIAAGCIGSSREREIPK